MTLRIAPAGTPPPTGNDWSGFTEIGYLSDGVGIQFTDDDREDWFDGSYRTDVRGSFSIPVDRIRVYDGDWSLTRTWQKGDKFFASDWFEAVFNWRNPYFPRQTRPQLSPHTTFRLHDPCPWAQPGALTLAAIRHIRNIPIADLMRDLLADAALAYNPRRFLT